MFAAAALLIDCRCALSYCRRRFDMIAAFAADARPDAADMLISLFRLLSPLLFWDAFCWYIFGYCCFWLLLISFLCFFSLRHPFAAAFFDAISLLMLIAAAFHCHYCAAMLDADYASIAFMLAFLWCRCRRRFRASSLIFDFFFFLSWWCLLDVFLRSSPR